MIFYVISSAVCAYRVLNVLFLLETYFYFFLKLFMNYCLNNFEIKQLFLIIKIDKCKKFTATHEK
jgi:hypothetical protein